mmetsp:Transcript_62019/g.128312  ORF Transcript_62019/g.128312 Transcript_62019/m.128312 type:complete len:211 (-) Transcript_62019:1138-1770(-)
MDSQQSKVMPVTSSARNPSHSAFNLTDSSSRHTSSSVNESKDRFSPAPLPTSFSMTAATLGDDVLASEPPAPVTALVVVSATFTRSSDSAPQSASRSMTLAEKVSVTRRGAQSEALNSMNCSRSFTTECTVYCANWAEGSTLFSRSSFSACARVAVGEMRGSESLAVSWKKSSIRISLLPPDASPDDVAPIEAEARLPNTTGNTFRIFLH